MDPSQAFDSSTAEGDATARSLSSSEFEPPSEHTHSDAGSEADHGFYLDHAPVTVRVEGGALVVSGGGEVVATVPMDALARIGLDSSGTGLFVSRGADLHLHLVEAHAGSASDLVVALRFQMAPLVLREQPTQFDEDAYARPRVGSTAAAGEAPSEFVHSTRSFFQRMRETEGTVETGKRRAGGGHSAATKRARTAEESLRWRANLRYIFTIVFVITVAYIAPTIVAVIAQSSDLANTVPPLLTWTAAQPAFFIYPWALGKVYSVLVPVVLVMFTSAWTMSAEGMYMIYDHTPAVNELYRVMRSLHVFNLITLTVSGPTILFGLVAHARRAARIRLNLPVPALFNHGYMLLVAAAALLVAFAIGIVESINFYYGGTPVSDVLSITVIFVYIATYISLGVIFFVTRKRPTEYSIGHMVSYNCAWLFMIYTANRMLLLLFQASVDAGSATPRAFDVTLIVIFFIYRVFYIIMAPLFARLPSRMGSRTHETRYQFPLQILDALILDIYSVFSSNFSPWFVLVAAVRVLLGVPMQGKLFRMCLRRTGVVSSETRDELACCGSDSVHPEEEFDDNATHEHAPSPPVASTPVAASSAAPTRPLTAHSTTTRPISAASLTASGGSGGDAVSLTALSGQASLLSTNGNGLRLAMPEGDDGPPTTLNSWNSTNALSTGTLTMTGLSALASTQTQVTTNSLPRHGSMAAMLDRSAPEEASTMPSEEMSSVPAEAAKAPASGEPAVRPAPKLTYEERIRLPYGETPVHDWLQWVQEVLANTLSLVMLIVVMHTAEWRKCLLTCYIDSATASYRALGMLASSLIVSGITFFVMLNRMRRLGISGYELIDITARHFKDSWLFLTAYTIPIVTNTVYEAGYNLKTLNTRL